MMKTTINTVNKVMLLGVLAMMLSAGSVASADEGERGERGGFGMRGQMEDGIRGDRGDRGDRGQRGERSKKGEKNGDKEAIMAAIEAGDYDQLSDQAKENISAEDFAAKVVYQADTAAKKAALETAVINNDFASFNAQIEAQKAEKEAKHDDSDYNHNDREDPTDAEKGEKLQERFDEARASYVATGEVSIKKIYTKRGPGKHFKSSHKGMVNKIIKTVDADRLEKALTKINDRIESIDNEVVLDLLEGIREEIQSILDAQK